MKKENKIRLIFWGIIWIIALGMAVAGVILYMNGVGTHGKIRKQLKPANDAFNKLSTIQRYRESGIDISSKVKDDRITVRYKTDTIDASYDFIYEDYLGEDTITMEYGNTSADKDISISVARFMIDALAVKNGHQEGEIFKNYQFDYFYNTNVLQGLGINDEGTITKVRINLNKVVIDNLDNTPTTPDTPDNPETPDNPDTPDQTEVSDKIKELNKKLERANKLILVVAKKAANHYSEYKTDISSITERNRILLNWIDYEDLTEADIKYLESTYQMSAVNDFSTLIIIDKNKNDEILGYKSYNELESIFKEKGISR